MIKLTTKKMPVSLSFGSFKTDKNEFLIPFFKKDQPTGFMGIKSGREFPYGAISYIGRVISSNDIIKKLPNSIIEASEEDIVPILDKYLERLQAFKIGNVITIEYLPDGDFVINKVAEKPPRQKEKKGKLP